MDVQDSCSTMEYKYYEQRLKTFCTWPKQMIPDKYALAKAGFVYTGKGDKVACYRCGVPILDWERTDNVWNEHNRWSPSCEYLKMIGWNSGINVAGQNKPKEESLFKDQFGQTSGFKPSQPTSDSNLFVYQY